MGKEYPRLWVKDSDRVRRCKIYKTRRTIVMVVASDPNAPEHTTRVFISKASGMQGWPEFLKEAEELIAELEARATKDSQETP